MKNHFHLLVRIKEEGKIEHVVETADRGQAHCQGKKTVTYPTLSTVLNPDSSSFNVKLPNLNRGLQTKKPNPTRQFSHLFNAYAQSFNKTFKRTGCLFETPFKRKLIDSDKYFRDLVVYIHSNPTHHQFTNDFKDFPWSSYGTILSAKPTKLNRNEVIGWFDDKANFIEVHKQKVNIEFIKELMVE
jgi:REP element-mobilizing transposase RayT